MCSPGDLLRTFVILMAIAGLCSNSPVAPSFQAGARSAAQRRGKLTALLRNGIRPRWPATAPVRHQPQAVKRFDVSSSRQWRTLLRGADATVYLIEQT